MTLGWSRACYVELVRKADTAAFIQCHVNAFEYLGGVPRRCLYDNAKVITLGRDEEKRPIWNERMLDFARRVGFEARLCQPYRAQTKGKVENGVKYVRRNMWPSIRSPRHHLETGRPEPARAGVVRRGGQRAGAWDDPPGAVGDAGRGAAAPGEASRSGHAMREDRKVLPVPVRRLSRVNYICRLASIRGSPPGGPVAGQRWSGSWGRQTPG